MWNKTVNYNGGTKRIVGPVLDKAGYAANARFVPSDNTFERCRASAPFAVDDIDDNQPPDDNDPTVCCPTPVVRPCCGCCSVSAWSGVVLPIVAYSRRRNSPATA